jgi:hypothetical protein
MRYEVRDKDGVLLSAVDVAPSAQEIVMSSLRSKASVAIAANNAFIALPTPTAAQVAAQTKAHARELNAVIRLLLNQLDTDDA